MVIYNPSESAVVHVVNPIDEYTGTPVAGGDVYIGTSGMNPPFTYIGSVPQDFWFGEGHPYEFNKPYTIVVKKDGYIFGAYQISETPETPTYLNLGDDITPEIKLLSCTTQTPNYPTGCDLLKHYDSNHDGYHSMDDTLDAIRDWYDGYITLTECLAIIKSWAGNGINYLCPSGFLPSSTNFYIIMAIMAAAAAFVIIRSFKK